MLLVIPLRLFLFPFIMAACFISMDQKFDPFGLNFTVLRILISIGILRFIIRRETRVIQWNNFDKLFLSWVLTESLVNIAQQLTFSTIITRSGVLFDSIGMYWLFRQATRTWDDVFQAVKIYAIFAIITAPFIALEKNQKMNFFSAFGSVTGQFHNGRFRAAGAFPHYIIMGCFWTSLLSLFYARIKSQKDKILYWVAMLAALSNVICSASSTPIITLLAMIFFWILYNYRMHGKAMFWGTCFGLFLLHLIMKAPVWHLISRINIFEGSTGWHRYFLFDNFIKHISEWYLIGTNSTAHWGHVQFDITNQFVLVGIRGGMITLLLFIILIYSAVKIPGKFSLSNITSEIKWMSWGICVTLLGHFVTFWGVSYFGQINTLLYYTLALVGFILEEDIGLQQNSQVAPTLILCKNLKSSPT
ncbi:hypothetical protein HGB07_04060 [Candidatus Roizmanbacteria bacterium]|nr:hypothetical protein [Candidatus Roizmanbacteria bacterium]